MQLLRHVWKFIVRNAVMSKGSSAAIVQNAQDFCRVAAKLMPSTKVVLIEDKEIVRDGKRWQNVQAVHGIKSCHVLEAKPNQSMKTYFNALTPVSNSFHDEKVTASTSTSSNVIDELKIGDWVLVRYDKQKYPGQVTKLLGSDVEVHQ